MAEDGKPKKTRATFDEKETALAIQRQRDAARPKLTLRQMVPLAFPSYFLYRLLESVVENYPQCEIRDDVLNAVNVAATKHFSDLGSDRIAITTAGNMLEEKVKGMVDGLRTDIRHTTLGWCLCLMRGAEKGMLYDVTDQSVIVSAAIYEEAEAERWHMWNYRKAVVHDTADRMEARMILLGLAADPDKRRKTFHVLDGGVDKPSGRG